MTVLDLDTLPPLPPLPDSLRSAVVTTSYAPTCPYCGGPVAGLLAGCPESGCRTREITADERLIEQ